MYVTTLCSMIPRITLSRPHAVVYIHIYTYVCACMYVCIYIYICIHTYLYIYVYMHMFIYIHFLVHIDFKEYTPTTARSYTYIYIYTHVHICIYIFIYIGADLFQGVHSHDCALFRILKCPLTIKFTSTKNAGLTC